VLKNRRQALGARLKTDILWCMHVCWVWIAQSDLPVGLSRHERQEALLRPRLPLHPQATCGHTFGVSMYGLLCRTGSARGETETVLPASKRIVCRVGGSCRGRHSFGPPLLLELRTSPLYQHPMLMFQAYVCQKPGSPNARSCHNVASVMYDLTAAFCRAYRQHHIPVCPAFLQYFCKDLCYLPLVFRCTFSFTNALCITTYINSAK
jgi:hypothetical protein